MPSHPARVSTNPTTHHVPEHVLPVRLVHETGVPPFLAVGWIGEFAEPLVLIPTVQESRVHDVRNIVASVRR
jgi:hypothetical protein